MNATTTTLLDDAKATTNLAEGLTEDELNEVRAWREYYRDFYRDTSVSGFSDLLEDQVGITDYLFACLVMDNDYDGFTSDNEDFEGLTQEEQNAFTAECKKALHALNA